MKTKRFLRFGVLFWVFGAPTHIQTLKKVFSDTRRSSRKASAAVQLPEYTAGAAGLLPRVGGGRTALTAAPKLRRQSGSPAAPAVRQLSYRSTFPFSSMLHFMDFRESRPKFLSPNSSQPWPKYPPLQVFT
jgi:hypothetical protein